MIIFIRHSNDEGDDPTFIHDPNLTREGKELAKRKGRRIIEKYGQPEEVFCSPFRRTRQTLKYMLRGSAKPKITYDGRLSRYFSSNEKRNPDVSGETIERCKVPIYETPRDFSNRVREIILDLEKINHEKKVYWCITHALVYKKIAEHYNVKTSKKISFMASFKI